MIRMHRVTLESSASKCISGIPPSPSLHTFSFTTIAPPLRNAARLRLRNAMRSASAIYGRHHWHHTTSKPDSSSGERGSWPTRARKAAVCKGCAGSQACKVPCRKVTLLERSAMPFHLRFCKGNLLSFFKGAWAVLAWPWSTAARSKDSTGSRITTSLMRGRSVSAVTRPIPAPTSRARKRR